ncbi:RNA polymerase sigma-28 factor precursor [compost metagenome]
MPGFLSTIALLIKELTLLVSYVRNNAFPQPLSEQEESRYLGMMAEGDAKARNLLIEHNLRLVAHIVKKFDNTGEDMEDLISIGTIGLIKAIESYRPNKGTKLATFAARCIENEILMHLRSLKKTRKDVSRGCPRSGRHPVFRWREAWRISLFSEYGSEHWLASKLVAVSLAIVLGVITSILLCHRHYYKQYG